METKKRNKFSIKLKLLLIGLLPTMALAIALTVVAVFDIRTGMQEEALQGLKAVAYSLEEIYANVDTGDYVMQSDGLLKKGDLVINDHYEIVDHVKNYTHYEVTLFYGDTRITTSLKNDDGTRMVGTKASKKVIETVLEDGKEYSDVHLEIGGQPYYGYYIPIEQNGEIVGMAFAGLHSEDIDDFINSKIILLVSISVVLLIVIVIINLIFSIRLGHDIVDVEATITEVSQGNLKVDISQKSLKRNDEIGSMARATDSLVKKLVEVIGHVKQSSKVLYDSGKSLDDMTRQSSVTTHEISTAVEDISSGAMTQAVETETASTNISQMGDIITEIVSSVDGLDHSSQAMKTASDESTVIISELSLSNDRTSQAIDKISEQVHTTNNSVQGIRQAVEMITAIATETNLLSLNASIEAARAGEHGRGFAVVASQIQKLADESSKSADDIKEIIDTLLHDSEQTVEVMDEVNSIMEVQRQKLRQTQDIFDLVTQGVNSTRKETEVIEKLTSDCNNSRDKIMDVIQNLAAISQENAASTQETTASMQELNANLQILANDASNLLKLSTELESSMDFFKI